MQNQQHITLGEGGRLVIPSAFRKELHIEPGDELIIKIQDGELRIFSQLSALAKVQKLLKSLNKVESATDDFLEFRKKDYT
jgi:hypothetical protein